MAKKKHTKNPTALTGTVPIYTIEAVIENGERKRIRRTCHGINAYELLGLLTMAAQDVAAQIRQDLPPPERIFKDKDVNVVRKKKR